jgi:RimJ/RimL family protein N-acetyltransferase
MPFPVLRLDRCTVRPFEEGHLTERYVSWLNDPEVVRYSEQRHRRHTLESCRVYFESFRGTADHFLAIEAEIGQLGHIGNISVAVDVPNRVADVSILVGEKRCWGIGLATAAWCGVLAELLQEQKMRKVTAGTLEANEPMLRLIRRCGMQIEGKRSRQFLLDGWEVDLVMAAAFAPAG